MTKVQKIKAQTFIFLILAVCTATLALMLMTLSAVLALSKTISEHHAQQTVVEVASAPAVQETAEHAPVIKVEAPKPTDPREAINRYVDEICSLYDGKVEPALVKSIIQRESEYQPLVRNGSCLGLMQVSSHWHSERAKKLGVTDFFDPYSNILLGVDYLAELFDENKDPSLVLMLYSMKHKNAIELYSKGKISDYAKTVLANAENYKRGE